MPIGGYVVGTGSAGTNRRSFGEIIDELARPINANDSTTRALAADAFRAAVRTMNRKGLWPWEYQEETVVMTPNVRYSTVGGTVKKPLSAHYIVESSGFEHEKLSYTPIAVLREKFTMNVAGRPETYSIPNMFETNQIQWYPTPSAAYSVKFAYYRETPSPRRDDETIEVPDSATEVYMAYAWAEFLKRLPSVQQVFPIAIALSEAQRAFREMSALISSPGDRMRETIV